MIVMAVMMTTMMKKVKMKMDDDDDDDVHQLSMGQGDQFDRGDDRDRDR